VTLDAFAERYFRTFNKYPSKGDFQFQYKLIIKQGPEVRCEFFDLMLLKYQPQLASHGWLIEWEICSVLKIR
jgi:hypothetical protein